MVQLIALAGTLIEVVSAVVIAWHILLTLRSILLRQGSDHARAIIADGVLAGLGFALAGTLLKMLALENASQIRAFAVILTMRTVLKRVFQAERAHALHRPPPLIQRAGLLPSHPARK